MKFDTVIIGGGLSGLLCGIRLQQNGNNSVIVSTGQSALHFSTGSFDLYSGSGSSVENLMDSIGRLINSKKQHPYAKVGVERLEQLGEEAKDILSQAGIQIYSEPNKNHYRVSPMGKLCPTWLTQVGYATSKTSDSLPWQSATVFNIEGYLDYFPHFISDELEVLGVKTKVEHIELPIFETLRLNPAGLVATSIARELDKEEHKSELLNCLSEKMGDSEVLLLPACFGLKTNELQTYLANALNRKIELIPTLPPSVAGSSMQRKLTNYYKQLGGVYMLGDSIVKSDIKDGKVERVYSVNHSDIPFRANSFVLATGGFFSKGLIATPNAIIEPLFNLDVDYKGTRGEWYSEDIFSPHNYQSFGVITSNKFNPQIQNSILENLYVVGATLNGYNPIEEGSGGGVSIMSALFVADEILKKEKP